MSDDEHPFSDAPGVVLICFDGSGAAHDALEAAARAFPGRRALVATAWTPFERLASYAWGAWGAWTPSDDVDDQAAQAALRVAGDGARRARELGLDAAPTTVSAVDGTAHALLDLVRSEHADIVVIGSVGHSTLGGALLGSVSQAIVHHCDRPVLLVRSDRVEPPIQHAATATGSVRGDG